MHSGIGAYDNNEQVINLALLWSLEKEVTRRQGWDSGELWNMFWEKEGLQA